MSSEEALIQRLLAEADEAVVRLDWATLTARCDAVLALEPGHERATRLRMVAAVGMPDGASAVPAASPVSMPPPEPAAPNALNQEIRRLIGDGYQITSQTPETASLVRKASGKSCGLIAVLLCAGILPGIIYIMWPRKDETVFLELEPDNTVRRTGQGSAEVSGSRKVGGKNVPLAILLLLLGIFPGIIYIMWPRRGQTVFLESAARQAGIRLAKAWVQVGNAPLLNTLKSLIRTVVSLPWKLSTWGWRGVLPGRRCQAERRHLRGQHVGPPERRGIEERDQRRDRQRDTQHRETPRVILRRRGLGRSPLLA